MLLLISLILIYPASITARDYSNITAMFGTTPRRDLSFLELVAYDKYVAEEHLVTTADGYILGVHRVLPNENCPKDVKKKVIVLMHGMYSSSDVFVVAGAGNKSHAYIYSDNCYDVWLPNCRGNKYSRNHTTLNPDKDMDFWNFDFDEMATGDLPAIIDYILEKTNETTMVYCAHAQGVAIMLILCSKQPEYNAKIEIGFGLSSATWLDQSRLFVLDIEGLIAPVATFLEKFGFYAEILKHDGLIQKTGEALCGMTTLAYPVCTSLFFAVFGYNEFQIAPEVLTNVVGHEPSGVSLKTFTRWGTVHKSGFKEDDRGASQNLLRYGNTTSPEYDLYKVTMKWVFLWSDGDYVCSTYDMNTLMSKLVNAECRTCLLSDENFGHLDHLFGKSLKEYCADLILSVLNGGFDCKGTVKSNY